MSLSIEESEDFGQLDPLPAPDLVGLDQAIPAPLTQGAIGAAAQERRLLQGEVLGRAIRLRGSERRGEIVGDLGHAALLSRGKDGQCLVAADRNWEDLTAAQLTYGATKAAQSSMLWDGLR